MHRSSSLPASRSERLAKSYGLESFPHPSFSRPSPPSPSTSHSRSPRQYRMKFIPFPTRSTSRARSIVITSMSPPLEHRGTRPSTRTYRRCHVKYPEVMSPPSRRSSSSSISSGGTSRTKNSEWTSSSIPRRIHLLSMAYQGLLASAATDRTSSEWAVRPSREWRSIEERRRPPRRLRMPTPSESIARVRRWSLMGGTLAESERSVRQPPPSPSPSSSGISSGGSMSSNPDRRS
mmetsp:Transcript_15564/g.35830  ORF Transcript_15564/g.35830 Transcript_15564/m.35830 type:complete len:234 (-) Transcript_15564:218-919(-)